ncbi:hypothetical protein BDK51DRAFT_34066 [Blyttiomyces helicus]|uniref:Uncharacterized protein n=1 Tax=Blyttiomyces helicus TaxID=388810 RepID=A0A4P9WNH3_9FUNG|nr:hypothetical protein BDK51DRAFT_34066 [Blyttiomyces helicus]|eukprot:RKO94042.1 hypothetical protein BDK51DRAFT_34066 [Blyttiomyces helicus]
MAGAVGQSGALADHNVVAARRVGGVITNGGSSSPAQRCGLIRSARRAASSLESDWSDGLKELQLASAIAAVLIFGKVEKAADSLLVEFRLVADAKALQLDDLLKGVYLAEVAEAYGCTERHYCGDSVSEHHEQRVWSPVLETPEEMVTKAGFGRLEVREFVSMDSMIISRRQDRKPEVRVSESFATRNSGLSEGKDHLAVRGVEGDRADERGSFDLGLSVWNCPNGDQSIRLSKNHPLGCHFIKRKNMNQWTLSHPKKELDPVVDWSPWRGYPMMEGPCRAVYQEMCYISCLGIGKCVHKALGKIENFGPDCDGALSSHSAGHNDLFRFEKTMKFQTLNDTKIRRLPMEHAMIRNHKTNLFVGRLAITKVCHRGDCVHFVNDLQILEGHIMQAFGGSLYGGDLDKDGGSRRVRIDDLEAELRKFPDQILVGNEWQWMEMDMATDIKESYCSIGHYHQLSVEHSVLNQLSQKGPARYSDTLFQSTPGSELL